MIHSGKENDRKANAWFAGLFSPVNMGLFEDLGTKKAGAQPMGLESTTHA